MCDSERSSDSTNVQRWCVKTRTAERANMGALTLLLKLKGLFVHANLVDRYHTLCLDDGPSPTFR